MANNSVYERTCTVTCTDNDKTTEAEVDNFREKESLNVYMATNKVHMKWNGRSIYIGNAFGFEFTTPGPKEIYRQKEGS